MKVPTHSSWKGCDNTVLLSGTEKKRIESDQKTAHKVGTQMKLQHCVSVLFEFLLEEEVKALYFIGQTGTSSAY